MKTIIYKQEELDEEILSKLSKEILDGKIVIFRTETVYGIGTNAYNKESCKKIFDIKKRSLNNPLLVLISSYDMLDEVAQVPNEIGKKLMDKFWPGPLTIILHRKENDKVFKSTDSIGDEIGVRMINESVVNTLIKNTNVPLVAPSANITGQKPSTKIKDIIRDFNNKVDYIIDSGDIENPIASTIVKVEDNEIYIQREGRIRKESLEKIVPIKESDTL